MTEVTAEAQPARPVAGTQAIGRAFSVLGLFRDGRADIGVVQVAESLDLSLSTAHRIARALVAEGYLAQAAGRERYRLGVQALLLGQMAQRALGMDVAKPILQRLADDTLESVNLGLAAQDHAVVIQRIESTQALRFSAEVGSRVELHATSMGKALLAFNTSFRAVVETDGELSRITAKTHGTYAELERDLEETRRRGWSIDDEESMLGVRCVAAPILAPDGVARAAVAVQAPAVRMPDERLHQLGPEVRAAADQLARLLPL